MLPCRYAASRSLCEGTVPLIIAWLALTSFCLWQGWCVFACHCSFLLLHLLGWSMWPYKAFFIQGAPSPCQLTSLNFLYFVFLFRFLFWTIFLINLRGICIQFQFIYFSLAAEWNCHEPQYSFNLQILITSSLNIDLIPFKLWS